MDLAKKTVSNGRREGCRNSDSDGSSGNSSSGADIEVTPHRKPAARKWGTDTDPLALVRCLG